MTSISKISPVLLVILSLTFLGCTNITDGGAEENTTQGTTNEQTFSVQAFTDTGA